MPRAVEATRTPSGSTEPNASAETAARSNAAPIAGSLADQLLTWLDDAKAENIILIDIKAKSSLGDYMIVATGRSDRHVGAIADQLRDKLREAGYGRIRLEGQPQCDWVLVDAGDVIVHVLRPEVREFYNLEKMWLADRPSDVSAHSAA
jgi:ribosome-associated protein